MLDAIPYVRVDNNSRPPIKGEAPALAGTFRGAFYSRCPKAAEICRVKAPELISVSNQTEHWVRFYLIGK